jgi:ribosomal protein L7/L12
MSFFLTMIVVTTFVLALFALVRTVLYRSVGQDNLRRVDRVVAKATGLPLPHESAAQANDSVACANDSVAWANDSVAWANDSVAWANDSVAWADHAPFELSEHVLELAIDPKRKIEACKAMRDETGCTLAEAKREVERIYARYQQIAARTAPHPDR